MDIEIFGVTKVQAALERALRVSLRAMTEAGDLALRDVVDEARMLVPQDLHTLHDSGQVFPPYPTSMNRVLVEAGFGDASKDPNATNPRDRAYAIAVHEGRPAGSKPPPAAALGEWAVRHGMPYGAGYAIARAIARRGIPATKFLEAPFVAKQKMTAAIIGAGVASQLQSLRIA